MMTPPPTHPTPARLLILVALLVTSLGAPAATAGIRDLEERLGGSRDPTDAELTRLPGYCKPRIAKDRDRFAAENEVWRDVFSSDAVPLEAGFIHLHHYCAGLLYLSRAERGLGDPSTLLSTAEGQFKYVLTRADPRFMLMPEIYERRGYTRELMRNFSEAAQDFARAIQLKPDYVAAYLGLIRCYESQNLTARAIEAASLGVKNCPSSPVLAKKLRELEAKTGPTGP